MKEVKKILIAAGLAIILSLVFLSKTAKLPETAAFLPKILIGIVILLSLGMVYETYYKAKNKVKAKRRVDERSEEDDPDEDNTLIDYKKAFIFGLMIALYIFTMKPIGYFIVTPLFILIAYRYLKSTSWRNTIIISVGFTLFVYGLFVVFLKLPVPMGIPG